jgi:DNA-binding transcriptional LysR family regulator
MNIRQLEAFRATMQCGSITAAAEALHISQPSVSRLIADLEHSIGFALFLRTGRGLTPTDEAHRFHQSVEGMFIGVSRLRETAETIRTTTGGMISIGVIQSIATLELPKAVRAIHERYDDVRFMIQSRNTPAILDALQAHQLDLGVVGRQPPYVGVEVIAETAAPYVCLLPEDHPLRDAQGPLDLEDLTETETFITTGDAYPDEMMGIDRALFRRLKARSRISAANLPVAAALVRETGAIAIADPFSAEQAVRMGGVVFRPIRQALSYHIAIVCRARDRLPRPAREFVEVLSKQIQERSQAVARYAER